MTTDAIRPATSCPWRNIDQMRYTRQTSKPNPTRVMATARYSKYGDIQGETNGLRPHQSGTQAMYITQTAIGQMTLRKAV
jgi:hypothetical protein